MLLLEPVDSADKLPEEIRGAVYHLKTVGFGRSIQEGLGKFNCDLKQPLSDDRGRIMYGDVIVGHVRGR